MTHFELVFIWCKVWMGVLFLYMAMNYFIICWKDLFIELPLYLCQNSVFPYICQSVLDSLFCFIDLFIFTSIPFSLYYWRFIIRLETSCVCPKSLFFSFKMILAILLSCLTLETPWTAACQVCLSFTVSQSLLKLMSIELMMPSNYLILCCLLVLLPPIFPRIRVFSNDQALWIR